MNIYHRFFWILFTLVASVSSAGELVLPAFALNLEGRSGDFWSSEIYLTNPSEQPVQVELARFLPGKIDKPTPCDLFMPPTRVVPPYSAAVWTAAGLATDLGCAERARGALVLRADGPVHITSRLVNSARRDEHDGSTVLSGSGEGFEAIPLEELPAAGSHLLPALMWHRNPCEKSLFDTFVGFANPGSEPVTVSLDIPHESAREVRVGGEDVLLPLSLTITAGSWRQIRLSPIPVTGSECGRVESFLVRVETDGRVAMYASVIDRESGDPRTVTPVPLTVEEGFNTDPLER
jgi:hypothetical protein